MVATVLLISDKDDWSAAAIADQLTCIGADVFRLDLGDFPLRTVLTGLFTDRWEVTLTTGGHDLDLADVSAVYYGRPNDFQLPEGMSTPERAFARTQARVAFGGLLASLNATWINHPSALAEAEYKPRQLAVAAEVGLKVPPTLITNSPEAVRAFTEDEHDVVIKPLAATIVAESGTHTAAWTRRLTSHDLHDLTGVEHTAHLVQQWVPKAFEVRLTMVGRHLFAVAIHAGSERSYADWRSDYGSLRYEVVDTPRAVVRAAQSYLSRFGLTYGAFDFVVTEAGEWVFLECNAAGMWGWLAEECGLSIAAAFADELTRERT